MAFAARQLLHQVSLGCGADREAAQCSASCSSAVFFSRRLHFWKLRRNANASTAVRAIPRPWNSDRPNKIYVGNLPWSCDKEELLRLFQEVGFSLDAIQEAEVVYERHSGKSRGFGYVTLTSNELAEEAVYKLDGHVFQGRSLRSGASHPYTRATKVHRPYEPPPAPAAKHTKVFVGSLPWGVDEGSLEEIFRLYGKVINAAVIYDRDTGRSRGFGFVTLSTPAEADAAVEALNGAECDGRKLRVSLEDKSAMSFS